MSLHKSPLFPIALIIFVDILGLTIILPLLPFYAQNFGARPVMIGALVSAYAFFQFLSGPFLGRFSDRWGRRPILLISQVGTFCGFLILAFAQNLTMLFIGRILDGITAGNITVAQAYISDVTAPKDRVRAFGIIGVSFGLGFLIGPALSSLLVSYGLSAPLFLSAGLSFLSIMGTFFLLPKTKPVQNSNIEKGFFISRKTWKRFYSHPMIGKLLVQFFIFSFIFTLFTSGFALFTERRFLWNGQALGAKEVGFIMAAMGLYGVILQGGLIGRMAKKWGEKKLVFIGFASCVLGYLIMAFVYDFVGLGISLLLSAFGTGVLRPALSSLLSQNVDSTEQGLVMGVSQSLGSIANVVAPLIAGLMIDSGFLSGYSLLMAGISLIGLYFFKGRKIHV